MRRVVAICQYDSARTGHTLGTRGLAVDTRTLFFLAQGFCVDLLIQEGGARLRVLHGQLTRAMDGRPVVSARVLTRHGESETDEHGEFSVPLLREKLPEVVIRTPDREIRCRIPRLGSD